MPRLKRTTHTLPKTYAGLVALFLPRPLHDRVDLDNATEMIDLLAGCALNADQADYLELLSDLVDKYERAHHPVTVRPIPVIQRLKNLVADAGLTASAFGRILGDRTVGGKILRGERELSKDHIQKLAAHFKLSPAYFF
jgi:HTH-type transcriptional regulator/antitoxin HigA